MAEQFVENLALPRAQFNQLPCNVTLGQPAERFNECRDNLALRRVGLLG